MARGFNLTAEINLRGPANIRQVVSNIRRQLGTINANVNVNIDPRVSRNVGNLNTRLNALSATLNQTAASATNATTAFNNLAAAMASVGNIRLPNNIPAQINVTANAATNAARAVAQTRTEFEDFGRQAGLAVRRFAAFSSVTSVIYGFTNALSAGIKQYIEFDRQIVRLTQVTNETKAGLGSLVGEITRLSTGFGVASSDIANVAVTLAQAGLNANDTRKALEALAKSALAPSFDSLNETVEGSIALMRQFGISAGQLEGALGSINAVAAAFAVEASDLITAIQRTGGVFAAASNGVSQGTDALNEFIAVFTSVRATTRESAETIATGLRTIFTRIQRADTIEALKEYGVTLTDLEGKFVGPYEAVRRLADGLGRLDPRDLKFSEIVEELGGFRQIGKVLPLIQQFATAQEALKIAQAGQGSLAAEAAKGQLALAVQFQKVREEFSALMRSFGESQSFQALVKIGLNLASALIKVADATKGLLPLIGVMAAFRGVSAITQFAGGFGGGFRGTGGRRANMGGIIGFAKGGSVPGVGNRDSVPAMLTPGEFVMSKAGVARAGRKNLEGFNSGGKLYSSRSRRYAYGGPIQKYAGNSQLLNQVQLDRSQLDKESGKPFNAGGSKPNRFNPKDKFNFNIVPQSIDVSELQNDQRYKELPSITTYMQTRSPTKRGDAFQNVVRDVEGVALSSNRYARLDGIDTSGAPVEIKSYKESVSEKEIGKKIIASSILGSQDSPAAAPLASQLANTQLDSNINTIPLGNVRLFTDATKITGAGGSFKANSGKKKKFFGGLIQKFAVGGETEEIDPVIVEQYGEIGQIAIKNKKQDQSIQQAITDTLVKTLADLGNEAGIRDRGVAIPSNLQRKLRKDGILTGRLDPLVVAGILNKAKQVDTDEKTRKRGLRKVAIAGLQPIDYSSDKEWTLDLGPDNPLNGQKYTAMIRGFSKQYLGDVKKLRERQRQASLDFAKDTTATEALGPLSQTEAPIVGPIRPLAIDFDETLAFGTKMVDESGKEDIASYSLRDKVEASLAKARPSRLAQRLSEVEQKNPGIVRRLTRVLTARPQTTADLVAATLNRFGLPYQATDITGVSKGLGTNIAAGKAANLAAIEKFIDDNEENIKAAEKKGVQSYRYQEPESFDDQKMYTKTGEGNIEGSLLEQALAQKLGYQINVDALEATRAIDFPAGLGNAASLFNLPSNIETEVKRTLNGSAFDKARSEFERYFTENPDRFNLGGLVQGFEDGSPGGVKDRSTKNIRRGSRGPKGFVPLEPKQYELFAEQAYAQAGEYGGPGWGNHLGVPLPKPLAEYAQKIQQWVFESGGAGMSLGKKLVKIPDNIEPDAFEALKPDLIKQYDGWYSEIEEILPFGRATATKTPAASAREARANAALAAEAGNLVYTQAEEAIGSFKKTGQLSFDQAIDSHIQKSFPGYISQLQNDLASETDPDEKASIQRKLSKAQKALPDYQALLKGAAVPNQGRITGLSETLYALLDSYGSEVSDAEVDNIIRSMGMKLSKKNIGGPLSRFADGGYVPALLTPGEAVIGPKLAKSIGYAKLNKMNYADRYASGGGVGIVPGSGNTDTFGPVPLEVGSFVIRKKATEALGFNNGGRIQKFFFGGRGRRAPAARPDTVSAETIGASTQATTALTQLAETLQALGVNGSRSAALLNRSYQATAAEAERAAQADLAAARAAGAAADVIFDLETAVQQATTATQNEIAIRQQLGDISGAAIQDALGLVQQQVDRARAAAEATLRTTPSATTGVARTEEEVQAELRAGENDRRRQAYETVAFGGGVTGTSIDLDALGADGDDLARVFQILARDSRTLDQMNQRLTQTTRQRIEADLASGAIDEDTARARRAALDEEISARRRAVEGTAAAEGATSPGAVQGAEYQARTMRNMAIMTVGTLVADVLNTKSSATEAGVGGAIAGASQTYGATQQLIQEATNMADSLRATNPRMANFAGTIGRVAGRLQVLAVVAEAARQAYNAVRNFAIELEKKRVETAIEGLAEGFEKLNKDVNQIDLRNELQSKVITAAQAAERQRQMSQDSASAGLVNGLDVLSANLQSFFSGDITASRQASARGQILETEGIIPYLKTLFAGQQGLENIRGRTSAVSGRESAAIFKPVAENINQVIVSRIKAGESVEDILGGPEAEDFKRSLVMADASLATHIRSIELDTSLTEEARQARIKDLISITGTAMLRERSETALREKTQKNFGNLVGVYTRSLQRMFNNMDQAINATVFSLEKMKNSVELSTSAFQGQAQAGDINLGAKNIIQNPTAYSAPEVQRAASVGGALYGNRSAEMTQLATFGETITSSVMSTINNTLRDQGGNVTNEALTRIIDRNLKTTLKDLGLPPELADKLAKEVGDSITDIRKEGEDSVDYAKLSEKIAGLGSVTEVAKNAQQSVIKALEHYQSVLNQYTNNLNRIIELEVSARDRSRKSIQLVTDASLNLAKALGKTIKVADAFAKRDAEVAGQTGGLTDPTDIFNQFLALDTTRQMQQSSVRQSAEQGLAGAADFVKFNNELKNTNIALRENRAALEDMANNTEKASAALDAIQQAQQKAAGRVSFLEKIVTATPDELESTNNALIRLQRNINGQQNTIQNSIGAQRAYIQALESGASATEAMREAQAAFANERKETLGALQDILPFLGDSQQGNQVRANVLETMLQEAGMGVSPLMQQVLNSLRNPEQDPATAAAIQYYNQAIVEQSQATRLLGQLDATLADRIAQSNAKLIVEGLQQAVLTFQNAELRDIATNVNSIVSIMKAPPPAPGAAPAAPGIATGGLIYASAGQMVNFQPRGTDTVPAMLTPGEFVVNRKATQANLPLLQSINNGYANGGKVSYYAAGGFITNYGDRDKTLGAGQTLEKPILKDVDSNKIAWDIATSPLFALPDVYTSTYKMMASAIPGKEGYGLDSPNIIPGPPVPGYTPDIVRNDYEYSYKHNNALMNRASALSPAKPDDRLYFQDPALETIDKLSKNDAEKKAESIKTKFAGIETVTLPIATIDASNFGDPLKEGDVFSQTTNKITTSKQGKSAGVFYKTGRSPVMAGEVPIDSQELSGRPALGVYTQDTYAMYLGAGKPHAVASATKAKTNLQFLPESPYFGKDYSGDWNIVGTNVLKYPELATGQGLDLILADKIAETNVENAKLNELLINTREFLKGNLNYTEEGSKLQEILFGLFSNTIPSATLTNDSIGTNLSIFDGLQNVSAITVAQKSMEADFIKGLELARSNKAKASKEKVKFGIPGLAGPLDEFTLAEGFKITDTINGGETELPFMVNGAIDTYLGKGFAERASKQTLDDLINKSGIKTSTITDPIKLDLPANIRDVLPVGMGQGIDIPVQYTQYTGKLFDGAKKEFVGAPFTYLLPDKIDKTLFQQLDTERSRLFTNKKYTGADILANSNLADPNVGTAIADLLKAQLNKDPDYAAKQQAVKDLVRLSFKGGPVGLLKALDVPGGAGTAGRDIFAGFSDNAISVPIGDFFVDKLQSLQTMMAGAAAKVDNSAITKGKVFSDKENTQATLLMIRGAMQLFNNLGGLPTGWVANYGGTQAMRVAALGNYKDASSYMSGLFNQAGGYISQALMPKANSPQAANMLNNAYLMIGGAAGAFADIAQGNTSLLKQFYDQKANIADVFRSYGTSARFGKVGSMALSGDWQNLISTQLQGTKIQTVGRDGKLAASDLSVALPENANVNDLVKLIFNPYNEFPQTSTRKDLIQKFGNDLFNLRAENSTMPYFDPMTLSWIGDGLTRLMNWYGGIGDWVGQDYFFDTKAQPDNAARMAEFIDSYNKAGQDIYQKAQEAQVLFGLANNLGPLPSLNWFTSRAAAMGLEKPQPLATGGVVYASTGKLINFQPRGTDTVPAMLTPGEFVVNRSATQKHLPLLQSINSGSTPNQYSQGGVVYLAEGSKQPVAASDSLKNSINKAIEVTMESPQPEGVQPDNLKQALINDILKDLSEAGSSSMAQVETQEGIRIQKDLLPGGKLSSNKIPRVQQFSTDIQTLIGLKKQFGRADAMLAGLNVAGGADSPIDSIDLTNILSKDLQTLSIINPYLDDSWWIGENIKELFSWAGTTNDRKEFQTDASDQVRSLGPKLDIWHDILSKRTDLKGIDQRIKDLRQEHENLPRWTPAKTTKPITDEIAYLINNKPKWKAKQPEYQQRKSLLEDLISLRNIAGSGSTAALEGLIDMNLGVQSTSAKELSELSQLGMLPEDIRDEGLRKGSQIGLRNLLLTAAVAAAAPIALPAAAVGATAAALGTAGITIAGSVGGIMAASAADELIKTEKEKLLEKQAGYKSSAGTAEMLFDIADVALGGGALAAGPAGRLISKTKIGKLLKDGRAKILTRKGATETVEQTAKAADEVGTPAKTQVVDPMQQQSKMAADKIKAFVDERKTLSESIIRRESDPDFTYPVDGNGNNFAPIDYANARLKALNQRIKDGSLDTISDVDIKTAAEADFISRGGWNSVPPNRLSIERIQGQADEIIAGRKSGGKGGGGSYTQEAKARLIELDEQLVRRGDAAQAKKAADRLRRNSQDTLDKIKAERAAAKTADDATAKAADDAGVKPLDDTATTVKGPETYYTKGMFAGRRAQKFTEAVKNAREIYEASTKKIGNEVVDLFYQSGSGSALKDAATKNLADLKNNTVFDQAFKDAIGKGANETSAIQKALGEVPDTTIQDTLTKIKNNGFDIDSSGNLVLNDQATKIMMDDSLGKQLYDTKVAAMRQRVLDDMANKAGAKKPSADYDNLVKGFDDSDFPGFKPRSWPQFVKDNAIAFRSNKKSRLSTGLTILAGILAVWQLMKQAQEIQDAGRDRPMTREPIPPPEEGKVPPGGPDIGQPEQEAPRPEDFKEEAKVQAEAKKAIERPNYYDELTYKEFASQQIVAGNMPPAPDKNLFTTTAFYSKDKQGSYRTTAYDQRSTMVDQSVRGNALGQAKGEAATRTAASQVHTRTAAFAPGGAPMDMRDVEDQEAVGFAQEAGKARRRGEAAPEAEGFTPVAKFGQPSGKEEDMRDRNWAIRAQAERGGRKITGGKSPQSQYKSSYGWWRNRLGEFTYYSTKNDKIRDRWRQGYNIKTSSRGNTSQLQVDPEQLSSGGVVYANTGMLIPYQPRGTDTVPAMLTPGEFVVNRAATQKHLPLLKAINSGQRAMSKGGVVYLQDGGIPNLDSVASAFDAIGAVQGEDLAKLKEQGDRAARARADAESNRQGFYQCVAEKKSRLERDAQSERAAVRAEEEAKMNPDDEDRAKNARQIRMDYSSRLREIMDGFRKTSLAREDEAMQSSGLGRKELLEASPRFKIENEFRREKGDINTIQADSPLIDAFKNAVTTLLNATNGGADAQNNLPNMYAVTVPGMDIFYRNAGVSQTYLDREKRSTKFVKLDQEEQIARFEDKKTKERELDAQIRAECAGDDPVLKDLANKQAAAFQKGAERRIADRAARAQNKAFGGLIYASTGTLVNYQPRGTDTVPAMLTPGEFVVNRKATQKNLGLLRSINSNSYSGGGTVYLKKGGQAYEDEMASRRQSYKDQMKERKDSYEAEMQRRRDAYSSSKTKGVSYQQAYAEQQQANPNAREQAMMGQQAQGGGPGGAPAISPQVQQAVGQASQAAFDPSSYGDVNKQMVIFGTLLTGVNQVLVQYGATITQLNQALAGGGGGGVNGNGEAAQGAGGAQGGLAGLATFAQKFDTFVQQLQQLNIPPEVNVNLVQNKPWDINVNGADALKALIEGPLGNIVQDAIRQWENSNKDSKEGQQ